MQSRRQFLSTGLPMAGVLGFAGVASLVSERRSFATETPPETTTIRLAKIPSVCLAPQYVVDDGRVQTKLLVAFLTMVALLIISGAVGLRALSSVNQYTKDLITLQRKIESYREVQLDATSQLYRVSTALLTSDQQTLNAVLRQINQFGYDVDRLRFVARDEVQLLERVRQNYDLCILKTLSA